MAGNKKLQAMRFESFNGMSRPAMWWSVPIMPLVGLLMAALITGIAGTVVFSWIWGLVFAVPFLSAIIALRFICLVDQNYLRRIRFGWRRIKLNRKYGRPLLLTTINPSWSKDYAQRFSQLRYAARRKGAAAQVLRSSKYGDNVRKSPAKSDSRQGDIV
ncbi:VirB3 family type IV secretion system protein [Pseudomonas fragariae (ex Marin et al. 2024)]|uniref:VirB3 family type IV secretion system protein n=1 Tax=Pseudomonas fragariae (ex Marin et al. 2024) TaxID=3080056 RepID=UPI003F7A3CEF